MNSFQTKLTVKTIKTDLRDLPKGLAAYDTAYDDTMARIFGQEMDFQESARRILSLVLCAKQPLRTSVLQHALIVEPHTTELDQESNLEVEDILSVCAGLITIDTESDTIRFVHYTTQEYLQRKRGQWLPRGEFEIARACLDYLLMEVADFDRRGSTEDMTSENKSYGLARYAIHYGQIHWNAVVHVDESLHNGLLTLFRGFESLCTVFLELFRIDLDSTLLESTPVHSFAKLGLLNLIRFCIFNNVAHDDGNLRTPLSCAAEEGHSSVVQLLLEHDAAVDSTNDRGRTSLAVAASRGHESSVCLLLEHNAFVDSRDYARMTALSHAAEHGHESTARLLLDNAADIEARDCFHHTPLYIAAEHGREAVVQLLLERGASVDSRTDSDGETDNYETPLMIAARRGFVSIMSLLLARNADIELRDGSRGTVLLHGVIEGREMVVQTLLVNGAAVDAKDAWGCTSLSLAAYAGHEKLVRLLLVNGAAVDAKDIWGWTPLSYATKNGHESVVRLLLDHNAAIDTADDIDLNLLL
jgi:ankyrin repeat protein